MIFASLSHSKLLSKRKSTSHNTSACKTALEGMKLGLAQIVYGMSSQIIAYKTPIMMLTKVCQVYRPWSEILVFDECKT